MAKVYFKNNDEIHLPKAAFYCQKCVEGIHGQCHCACELWECSR